MLLSDYYLTNTSSYVLEIRNKYKKNLIIIITFSANV